MAGRRSAFDRLILTLLVVGQPGYQEQCGLAA